MGNLWLLIAAPAAVLAAVLFWRVFDIQHSDYETHHAEVRVERAQFDAEFARATTGKADATKEAKAKAAEAQLVALKAEQDAKKRKALDDGKSSADALDKLINNRKE